MAILDYEKAAHLYRRAGFGASEDEINALVGMDASAAADRFLTFKISKNSTQGRDAETAARTWLKRMLKKPPLQEKMTFFWHGHFANSIEKVDDIRLMHVQNGLFRLFAAGNFDERAFDDPNTFDLAREKNPHVSFGRGPHQCLGKHVASLEMKILLEELMKRTKDITPAGDIDYVRDAYSRGVYQLPVTITPK